jgi:sulfite reductase beta subunit-like hemoprotein
MTESEKIGLEKDDPASAWVERTPPPHSASDQLALADRCPGVLVLHRAEDGWLARIRLPGGRLSVPQFAAIADLANMGNGLVELTARANVQVRGLPEFAGGDAAELLKAVDLMPSETHDRVRNILASPLAGRHARSLVSTDELVEELDHAICGDPRMVQLSGRFLFGIDDGAGYALDENVDIGLVAERADKDSEVCFRLVLGGVVTDRRVTADRAVAEVLDACHAFLAMAETDSRIWRVQDLTDGITSLADTLGARLLSPSRPGPERPLQPRMLPLGVSAQRDGRFAATTLAPLGRIPPAALSSLPRLLGRVSLDIRVSPWRTLTFIDIDPAHLRAVTDSLRRLGLLVDESGWHGLTACAGLGACANAIIDVRLVASQRAPKRSENAPAEHWSACERQCGRLRSDQVSAYATHDQIVIDDGTRRCEVPNVLEALALLEKVTSP